MIKPRPYLLKHSAFIHTPKTGGSWVNKTLFDMGLYTQLGTGHLNKTDLGLTCHCFTFVRQPVSWIKSMWAFQKRRFEQGKDSRDYYEDMFLKIINHSPDIPDNPIAIVEFYHDNINVFIERLLKYQPNGINDYFKYFTEGCTQVGKQETLSEDLIQILNHTGEVFNEKIIRRLAAGKVNVCVGKKKIKIDSDIETRLIKSCKWFFDTFQFYGKPYL